jgi:hypothetical protein
LSAQVIPLNSAPNQRLSLSLNVDGKVLAIQLAVRYNQMANYWQMSVFDQNGILLLEPIPMLTGAYPAANLLEQNAYMQIGSAFVINVTGTTLDYPQANNLGSDFLLVWDDTPGFVALPLAA